MWSQSASVRNFQISVPKVLYFCETPPGVLCSALESSAEGGYGPVGDSPEETTRMLRGLQHFLPVERLRELGLFILEMRRLWSYLPVACLKGACKKNEERLFSRACCNRTRGNDFKLKEGRFGLDIRRLFEVRVVIPLNRMPREIVHAPSLETFKARWDGALSDVV